jgi:hypothetical protein
MNIFYIDESPFQSAEWLVDKHVVKMILESAQLLSTAHRVLDGEMVEGIKVNPETGKTRKCKAYLLSDSRDSVIYSATHVNHPSAIWARESVENYNWLVDHFFAIMAEYTYRYDKVHKCFGAISATLQSPPHKLTNWDMTEMPSCMDEKYIVSKNPIDNYRNYYKNGKSHLHSWKKRTPPEWII